MYNISRHLQIDLDIYKNGNLGWLDKAMSHRGQEK